MQREPFDPADFEGLVPTVPWVRRVVALPETTSTNADAVRLAGEGAPEGTVVVADVQTAGRGRLDRVWLAEPGVALLASWIVRPEQSDGAPARTLLPLAAGVAAAAAIERVAEVSPALKWPNDLLGAHGKLGGILCEATGDGAVVVGIGVNVRQDGFELAIADHATSLLIERARPVGRARLLGTILAEFSAVLAAPGEMLGEYRRRCATIGREVRVERSGADPVVGIASGVRDDGALVVRTAGGEVAVSAGDVVHVR